MSIRVVCPECDVTLNLAPELAGKRIRCKKCGNTVSVPLGDVEERSRPDKPRKDSGIRSGAAPRGKGDDDEPRSRRSRADEDDDRPGRKMARARDDDEAPRRRSRDDDDDDDDAEEDRPRRKAEGNGMKVALLA